jgi:hypothetical protein
MALVSRDGTKLLYSHFENDSGVPALKSLSLATGDMTYLPIPTLAEKCAWGNPGSRFVYCAVPRQQPRASFIDEWYQGLATSDDVLWRFDLVTGEAKQLVDLYEELKVRIDAVNLLVSSDEHYLVFRSLRNDYLWALELPYEAPQTETTPVETPNETP